jgi:hypothetical protein
MGITPITSLTLLPQARSIQADLDPLPMERVENSARTGDETYSPSGGKSTRGSEDDASEDGVDDLVEEPGEEAATEPGVALQSRPINFFA